MIRLRWEHGVLVPAPLEEVQGDTKLDRFINKWLGRWQARFPLEAWHPLAEVMQAVGGFFKKDETPGAYAKTFRRVILNDENAPNVANGDGYTIKIDARRGRPSAIMLTTKGAIVTGEGEAEL